MSGIDCENCGRKTQTYLCSTCAADLKEMLLGLAGRTSTNVLTGYSRPADGWIDLLEQAALGQTRLGESARRSTERTRPLLVHLGPNGDWTGSPSELLDDLHTMLVKWVVTINTNTETLGLEDKE